MTVEAIVWRKVRTMVQLVLFVALFCVLNVTGSVITGDVAVLSSRDWGIICVNSPAEPYEKADTCRLGRGVFYV